MRLAWLAGLVLLADAAAHAAPPLCRAERLVEPPESVVGQPVLHRVRIERRAEVEGVRWATSLSFPSARAEWLHGQTGPGPSAETVVEERRVVLFAGRAGRLALPAAELECESRDRIERVPLAAGALIVREPPTEGRPDGWNGLIGPVEVGISGVPDRMRVGESARVTVVVTGMGNVWAAPTPWRGALAADAAELLDRPPELARDAGRELVLRRYFAFDLVPRQPGVVELPDVLLAYFDPARGRYDEARAPGVRIAVDAAAIPAEPAAPSRAEPTTEPPAPSRLPWAGLFGIALVAGGLWALARRRRGPAAVERRPGAGVRTREAREALRDALARGAGDPAAASACRALREHLAGALPGARTRAVEDLAGDAHAPRDRAAVALLGQLETARFAGETEARLLGLAREAEAWLAGR